MSLPAFALVGVPRAGTTSLYHYLGQHPQVNVSSMKEVNFLAYPGEEAARANTPWLRFPVTTLADYERLFADGGDRVGVDFSASCFRSPVAIERIRRHLPAAGLLIVLRDPVARAYSAYLNQIGKGYERRSPEVALAPGQRAVDNSFYAEPLSRYLDAFGPEAVRVWLFDDLVGRPRETMVEVFGHLGVDPGFGLDLRTVYNRASVSRSWVLARALPGYGTRRALSRVVPERLAPSVRRAWRTLQAQAPPLPQPVAERLRRLYTPDILRVQELLGRDLSSWLEG